jgi:hypothetical protein
MRTVDKQDGGKLTSFSHPLVANEFQLGHATRRGKTSSEQLGKPQFI